MKKVINKYMLLFSTLLLVTWGCAVTDMDRSVDFDKYKAFAWGEVDIKTQNPLYNSALINKNIKSTVEKELAKRGIVVDTHRPDFLISYHTYTEKKQNTVGRYNNYPYYPYGFSPYFRYYGFGGWPSYGWYGSPSTYTEGTLIIDITDAKSKELIWRGSVSGNIDNVAHIEKQISKGIRAIMKKYPAVNPNSTPAKNDTENVS